MQILFLSSVVIKVRVRDSCNTSISDMTTALRGLRFIIKVEGGSLDSDQRPNGNATLALSRKRRAARSGVGTIPKSEWLQMELSLPFYVSVSLERLPGRPARNACGNKFGRWPINCVLDCQVGWANGFLTHLPFCCAVTFSW